MVYCWTQREAARRARGLYLVFPKGPVPIHWDQLMLDTIGRCNDLPLNEEFSPLFEVRLGRTRIYSRAHMRNRAPWWQFWRRYRREPAVIYA